MRTGRRSLPLAAGLVVGGALAAVAVAHLQPERAIVATAAGSSVGGAPTATAGTVVEESLAGTATSETSGTSAGARPVGAGVGGTSTGGPATGGTASTVVAPGEPIRIGVGLPDLGVVGSLGPGYDDGDVRAQMDALLAGWRETGRVPVNGHDVEFVYETYTSSSPEAQRAACLGWALDDDVVAVIAVHSYWAAGECVAGEYGIPLLLTEMYDDNQFANAPVLFTLPQSETQNDRAWVDWAVANGLLDQDTSIGLYYSTHPDESGAVTGGLLPELERLGFADQIVDVVRTDEIALGSPSDNIAAQRFAANGVDLAWLLVGPINQTNFMQTAASLLYRPTYLASDWLGITNDTAASTFPSSQYGGTLGMSAVHFGEAGAGIEQQPSAAACVENYAAHGGPRVDRGSRPAEWTALVYGCDLGEVMLTAIERAGDHVDRASVVAALESYSGSLGMYGDVEFGPGRHAGASTQRTLRWSGSCTCWQAQGDFSPFPA